MKTKALSSSEIGLMMSDLNDWLYLSDETRILKDFEFSDFASAWAFMNKIANFAEEIGHHPDWSNSWNKVSISLSTHDLGALTSLDFSLAKFIDSIEEDFNV